MVFPNDVDDDITSSSVNIGQKCLATFAQAACPRMGKYFPHHQIPKRRYLAGAFDAHRHSPFPGTNAQPNTPPTLKGKIKKKKLKKT